MLGLVALQKHFVQIGKCSPTFGNQDELSPIAGYKTT